MIVMGHVVNAFGIRGWIRVYPYTEEVDGLLNYKSWWLGQKDKCWHEKQLVTGRINGNMLDAKLAGSDNRDQALQLKGMRIAIPRDKLPRLQESGADGYYWSDLIGAEVINLNNEKIGTVVGFWETGANDVMRVRNDNPGAQEILIPFVDQVIIKKVDVASARIVADWGLDY